MIRVGINGFGRIGRAIFRANAQKQCFEVVAINDVNPDNENLAYTLNYDTLYGRLDNFFKVEGNVIRDNIGNDINIYHHKKPMCSVLEIDYHHFD